MAGIRAGLLTRRVSIQQGKPGSDAEGNATLTPTAFADVSADVATPTTQDLLLAAQRGEQLTHMVTIRYRKQFPAPQNLWVIFQGRTFYVLGVTDPDEEHTQLVLRCQEFITTQVGAA